MKHAAALIMLTCLVAQAHAQNGGTSCATATDFPAFGGGFTSDTTSAPDWMRSFGPLVSPAHDVVYTFIASTNPKFTFSINPSAASYTFAVYLIASCEPTGAEPAPIGATGSLNSPITQSNISTPLISGQRYYIAVTGAAAGGATANGTVNFSTFLPIELNSFGVD